MPWDARKPLELPPEIARAFVEDMQAYFDAPDQVTADGIAARQLTVLRGFQGAREKRLRLSDVKRMFDEMRDFERGK